MSKFRNTKKFDEIYNILAKAYKNTKPINVWQTIGEQRVVLNAMVKSLNKKDKKIILIPFEKSDTFKFTKNEEIFLKTEDNLFLFKGNIDFTGGKILSLNFPNEVHIIELRDHPRKSLVMDNSNAIDIEFIDQESKKNITYRFPLIDISLSGVGAIADSNQVMNIKQGMVGIIKKIGSLELEGSQLEGKIVYILPLGVNLKVKSLHSNKIGIKFSKDIDETIFDHLKTL